MRIGVLDIQGSVEEHISALKKCGIAPITVKTKKDLREINGLIIPGGESTTIGKLLKLYGLDKEIRKRALRFPTSDLRPLAVYGTCAGAILLAKKIANQRPDSLSLMDVEISRNAYGRQLDSFETSINIPKLGIKNFEAVFIRAPRIKRAFKKAKVLAEYNGKPVMVQQENLLVTTFHPELTNDLRIHKYFLELTKKYASKSSK
ncbi:pyridoxal 5'-phosphate synthase glutaminase subunit PdxT [Candidatus Peregrinibacteria bacterium]|nr:pyridoxal 5'-phosphate synthase glutaminase subunit PdxT [Candidatus Peregrinibacteria bacterium]